MMLGRPPLLAVTVLATILAAGCGDKMRWDYRDDPYLASMAGKGENETLRNVNSTNEGNRRTALRLVAFGAARARAAGDAAGAERLENVIIRRYRTEREPAVRLCIIRLCAPACGRGSVNMVKFLRARIAAGEYPGHAALSLAALGPRRAVDDILPLARHPAPEVRYQAATALSVLGDPKGYQETSRIWRSMGTGSWPAVVDGQELDDAGNTLKSLAEHGFGRRLM